MHALVYNCGLSFKQQLHWFGFFTKAPKMLKHVDSIYHNELQLNDLTEFSMSASYLDIFLNRDITNNGKLSSKHNDKRGDFNFSIVNFPYLYM